MAPGPCKKCGRCEGLIVCDCGTMFDFEETDECPICGQKYIIKKGCVEATGEGDDGL